MSEGERGNQGVMFSLAIHRAGVIVQPGAADADKAAGWGGKGGVTGASPSLVNNSGSC